MGIDLDKDGIFLSCFFGNLLVYGCDLSTGAAPVGIKVGNDGQTGGGRVFLDQAVKFVGGSDLTDEWATADQCAAADGEE